MRPRKAPFNLGIVTKTPLASYSLKSFAVDAVDSTGPDSPSPTLDVFSREQASCDGGILGALHVVCVGDATSSSCIFSEMSSGFGVAPIEQTKKQLSDRFNG